MENNTSLKIKTVLGLDLGTNSIGWAVTEQHFQHVSTSKSKFGYEEMVAGKILGMGSRIIPMSQDILGDFKNGTKVSQTATRTKLRGTRRIRERYLLRRQRLHRVLHLLGFLPEHYDKSIDFQKRLGQFFPETEPKLAYNNGEFIFKKAYEQMREEFAAAHPELLANGKQIPYDWTIYFLRKKALHAPISGQELAWILLQFNQKRGYYQLRGEDENEKNNKLEELHTLKIVEVKANIKYILTLENNKTYYHTSETPLFDWVGTSQKFVVTTYLEKDGTPKKEKDGTDKCTVFLKEDAFIYQKNTVGKIKKNEKIEEVLLKITDVKVDKEESIWYSLVLENGWTYRRTSKISLENWKGTTRDFIVTTEVDEDGLVKMDKYGHEKKSFRAPAEDDWQLRKSKTERDIEINANAMTGAYIYEKLLANPSQKIKGKLVRTIERKFYKNELKAILETQISFAQNLQNKELYQACVRALYPRNVIRQNILSKKDFVYLLLEDIIFCQRPLRSKKSEISDCPLEERIYKEKGETKRQKLRCISRFHPVFQEFRLWQWIKNLKIYAIDNDQEPTKDFLQTPEQIADLYEFLSEKEHISEVELLKFLLSTNPLKPKELTEKLKLYRWNYVRTEGNGDTKKYPCAETKAQIARRLDKVQGVPSGFLTDAIVLQLWHIIYSITDKIEFEKALTRFAQKHHLDTETFVANFKNFRPFEPQYGSYSEKAIKKMLPVMRVGRYWRAEALAPALRVRLEEIADRLAAINYEATKIETMADEHISKNTLSAFLKIYQAGRPFGEGLGEHEAKYLVYNRHSEGVGISVFETPQDLANYISQFKQYSLRNPIVEQVMLETLRLVKDLWEKYTKEKPDFRFSEIHLELARELKKNADERKKDTANILKNEDTNLRLKKLLIELAEGDNPAENVRPYSPNQLEALKIYEEGALLAAGAALPEEIQKISKQGSPSKSDLVRYRLWLEQAYRSPYTGQMIPLSKLFTPDYEIEHIIPQKRYFDDSLSNKVICETAINKAKDKYLGLEFIKIKQGDSSLGLLSEAEYRNFVEKTYPQNHAKRKKLLLEEIPEKMINRQLNDTRYIGKFVMSVLSNVVRVEKTPDGKPDDGVNSVNMIAPQGAVTAALRQDWGLNQIWNTLVTPRFERLNKVTKSAQYGTWEMKEGKRVFQTKVPLDNSKGFSTKRIDHRHHALDALVVSLATRSHINYLNNQSAQSVLPSSETPHNAETPESRDDLKHLLCVKKYNKSDNNDNNYSWVFRAPYLHFVEEAKQHLEKTVVSFKQNLRVLTKTRNKYESWTDADGNLHLDGNGNPKKMLVAQKKGAHWAIRKSLHKASIFGKICLKKQKEVSLPNAINLAENIVQTDLRNYILGRLKAGDDKKKIAEYFKDLGYEWQNKKVDKVEVFYWDEEVVAKRTDLDISFDEAKIKSITDTGIQKILLHYLKEFEGQTDEKGKEIAPETLAFSPEGIEKMNQNIEKYNDGKPHKPILAARVFEPLGLKFRIGENGNKKAKYAEADKGTNLYFAIYQNAEGGRTYDTVPLNLVIERRKQGLSPVAEKNQKDEHLLFTLSPNDLVYVPSQEEINSGIYPDFKHINHLIAQRIYKFVNASGNQALFVPNSYAKDIMANENGSNNKSERMLDTHQNNIVWDEKDKPVMIKTVCRKLELDRLGNILRMI